MTARNMACSDVARVLSQDRTELTASTARSTLEHVSGCERCSLRLKDAREHAIAMLTILEQAEAQAEAEENPALEKQRDKVIRSSQREYLVIGKALARFLGDGVRQLATPVPADILEDAFSHLEPSEYRDPIVARLALAQLEAGLALSALIGPREATLSATGVLEVGEKTIPPNEIANLLRDSAGGAAEDVWRALVRCAIDGTVGMPGFRLDRMSGDTVRLKAVLDPVPEYDVRVTE
jgi:hypothetical protein